MERASLRGGTDETKSKETTIESKAVETKNVPATVSEKTKDATKIEFPAEPKKVKSEN